MFRKRDHNISSSDWDNYKEHFSDLLQHQHGTPQRKRRFSRRKNQNLTSISQEIDDDVSSDDDKPFCANENWVEQLSNDLFSSPVLRKTTSTNQIKSTPSGSPILLKSCQKVRRNSLIPISPITPGINWKSSIDRSVFSVHAHESTHELISHDQTTLAVPLDASENDINDFTQLQDTKIERENLTENGEELEISECDFESQKLETKQKYQLDTTGSKWIKVIQDKIDEEWRQKTAKFSDCGTDINQSFSYFDSGKKEKFIKGGLAEQLTRILKKETSQKSVFAQRIKTGKIEKQKPESLVLKIISDLNEGILRIIECKEILPDGESSMDLKCFTLILPEDVATTLNLTLGGNLRLYPPYYKINGSNYTQTVLLSAYCITADDGSPSKFANCSENSKQKFSQTLNCESLLKSLEAQSSVEESISVVTTIQRIFCRYINGEKWSILCSDAYGAFFVVEIASSNAGCDLTSILVHGEGQRVAFKDIYLSNRATRSQIPALFCVIDSIWSPTGDGLMHINSSQSQNSANAANADDNHPILPPSFCYFLHTDKDTTVTFPKIEIEGKCKNKCGNRIVTVRSDLNRHLCSTSMENDTLYKATKLPTLADVARSDLNRHVCSTAMENDTLYKATKLLTLSDVDKLAFSDERERFSVFCKFVSKETPNCESQDIYCTEHNDENQLFVTDIVPSHQNSAPCSVIVIVKNSCFLDNDLISGCFVVFKDVFKQFDSVFADSFSRVKVVNCVCEAESFLKQEVMCGPNENE